MHVEGTQQDISARLIEEELLLPRDDSMEEVRPGTGREAGLGHAVVRAPKAAALGDAWIIAEKHGKKGYKTRLLFFISSRPLASLSSTLSLRERG